MRYVAGGPTTPVEKRLIWRDDLPFWEDSETGLLLPAMMGAADKPFRFGPVAMSNTLTTNILNGPVQAAAGTNVAAQDIYMLIKHIRIVNKTAGAVTFSLWLGATGANAAGTEVIGSGYSVAANSAFDWYGSLRMVAADFLVGGASAATSLSIEGEGVMAII